MNKGYLLLGLALQGCLSGPPKTQVQKPPDKPPTQEINFTAGTGDAFGPVPKHEKRWTVNWKSMVLQGLQSTGISEGQMSGVSGMIFKAEQPVLRFKSDRGHGDKANEVLVLQDHVVASKPDGSENLTADTLTYLAKRKLLIATGHVRVYGVSGDGTFSQLVATSDLNHVGTPDMFDLTKNELGPRISEGKKATATLHLKKGTVELQFSSFKYDIVSDGNRYTLTHGFDGNSPDQGLRMSGDSGHMLLVTLGKLTKMKSGDADGKVSLTKTVRTPAGPRVTHIAGSHADLTVSGNEEHVKLRGPVKIIDENAEKHQSLIATGATGDFELTDQESAVSGGLLAGRLDRNVVLQMEQQPVESGGQPGTLNATGDHLTYAARTKPAMVRLDGNVYLQGANGKFAGKGWADSAALTLNPKGEVGDFREAAK